ncbi:MAG: hypothetical protein ABIO94_06105 [Opitutaceae bacterium]
MSPLRPQFSIGVLWLGLLVTSGCQPRAGRADREMMREAEALMKGYFEGSLETARFDLQRAISIAEDSTLPLHSGRAQWVSINYLRLHELERRFGSEVDGEVALRKARYWRIKQYELALANGGRPMDAERKREMLTLESEEITRVVTLLDRSNTSGQGTKFESADK